VSLSDRCDEHIECFLRVGETAIEQFAEILDALEKSIRASDASRG